MTGVVLHAGFDNGLITRHLTALAIADAKRFDSARVEIGEYMLGEIQDAFDTQKLFDGSSMPQSKAAIARKGKTLIRKHRLYDSYVYQLARGGVELGSALIYAAIHHFGGATAIHSKRGPSRPLPARPVMGITPKHEQRLGAFLIAEIEGLQ